MALFALTASLATAVLWACKSMPAGLASAILVATLGGGFWYAGWIGRGSRRLKAVCWLQDGRWLLMDEANRVVAAKLHADTRVFARCVWLHWAGADPARDGRLRRSLLLAAGDIADSELRRLLVRLRIEGPAALAAAPGASAL